MAFPHSMAGCDKHVSGRTICLCTGKTSAWLEVAGYYIGHIQNEFCGLAALGESLVRVP